MADDDQTYNAAIPDASVVRVADLVNQLFETHRHPSGRQFKNKEVEHTLRGEINQAYLSKVRRGLIADPGRNHLLLLCQFFGVPSSYFFPELAPLAADETSQDTLHAALRSFGLNDEARRYLVGLAEIIRAKDSQQ